MQKIIFTDLDGTLLDHDTYSYDKAKPALNIVKKKNVPLIFCTSKTKAELDEYKKKLRIKDPIISENGGGIFIPKGYFDFGFRYDAQDKDYYIIKLGTDYRKLTSVINRISRKYSIVPLNKITAAQFARDSGLTVRQARLALKRNFDEGFRVLDKREEKAILKEIRRSNLNYTIGGRYHHIIGRNDKGRAVKILTKLFRKKYGKIKTIGLGDSQNDFKMLDNVDIPFIVMKKNGKYSTRKYKKAKGVGPAGWNKAVKEVLL